MAARAAPGDRVAPAELEQASAQAKSDEAAMAALVELAAQAVRVAVAQAVRASPFFVAVRRT